ncbi:MAG: hypothetical protein V7K97_08505 [Nostoc sp.]|uniref:hypothetical protein n=1 Tax=Nostoc sp. TaxID=1180 RepID=UPI002FF8820A
MIKTIMDFSVNLFLGKNSSQLSRTFSTSYLSDLANRHKIIFAQSGEAIALVEKLCDPRTES